MDPRGGLNDQCGMADGDATDLDPGTVLRPLGRQFPPQQQLAAEQDGHLLLFNAYFPPD